MSEHDGPVNDNSADEPDAAARPDASGSGDVPAPPFLWTLRMLAFAGFGVAAFLAYVHVDAWINEVTAKAPGCGRSGLVDCNTVLNSPRWSNWFGVPVVAPALLVYIAVNAVLWVMSSRHGDVTIRRLWFTLYVGAAAIAGSAVWFTYVQLGIIERICTYCLAEHAIGVTLALLIWLFGGSASVLSGGRRASAATLGLLGVAILIGGQLLQEPRYTEPIAIGDVKFVRGEHPIVGLANAPNMTVETIDYTCPRCKRFFESLRRAKHMLGPDYAVTVLTFPLNHRCNRAYAATDARHEAACDLAKIAHAVWVAQPARFEEMHAYLFVEQDGMTVDKARAFAASMIGESALDSALTEVDGRGLIKRDVDMALKMDVRNLPGFFVGDRRFNALPEDADVLARTIVTVFAAQRDEATGGDE